MINTFCKTPLWKCSRTLIAVAQGQQPAETVIRDARLVNVNTREVLDHTGRRRKLRRIAYVGDAEHCIGPDTEGDSTPPAASLASGAFWTGHDSRGNRR